MTASRHTHLAFLLQLTGSIASNGEVGGSAMAVVATGRTHPLTGRPFTSLKISDARPDVELPLAIHPQLHG
jgi:hypothetical protein